MILWCEPLMVSHHPAKFGGHRHYGNGDMFSVGICLEGQNSGWPCLDPSLLFILCHAYTHKISGGRHNNLLVRPMKDSRSWSHMSTRTTEQPVCPKAVPGIRKRNKRMAIAKLFAFCANAKMLAFSEFRKLLAAVTVPSCSETFQV